MLRVVASSQRPPERCCLKHKPNRLAHDRDASRQTERCRPTAVGCRRAPQRRDTCSSATSQRHSSVCGFLVEGDAQAPLLPPCVLTFNSTLTLTLTQTPLASPCVLTLNSTLSHFLTLNLETLSGLVTTLYQCSLNEKELCFVIFPIII